MKKFKKIRWAFWDAALASLAAFFGIVMRGYNYIAYALLFVAALITAHRFFPKKLWTALVVLVCVGLIYFTCVEIPIIRTSRGDKDIDAPYVIVLGAAVHGDDLSLALRNRLVGALDYMNAHPDAVVIVSGGQGKGENLTEAQAMYDWLTAQGLDGSRIIMEDKATSTLENLQNSFAIIRERGDEPEGNVAVVSSSYHLYRAKLYARMLGVEVFGIPGASDYPLTTANYFIREAFGVTYLWVFGK